MNKLFFAIALFLVLSACAREVVVSDSGREYVREFIEPDEDFVGPVPIRLTPGEQSLIFARGRRMGFSVEPIWTRIFSTDESIEETLSVTSARFTMSTMWYLERDRTDYVVNAEFRCGDKVFPISAEAGRYMPRFRYNFVKRDIVQQVVREVADTASELMHHCKESNTGLKKL